jgi:hypothetical protein
MFLGHYAVAFAAKKAAPKISLGTMFIAAQFLDLLWPLFVLLGWEHVQIDPGNTVVTPLNFYDYPFSHSLLGAVGWALFFGTMFYAIRRSFRSSFILAGIVLSHPCLEFFHHVRTWLVEFVRWYRRCRGRTHDHWHMVVSSFNDSPKPDRQLQSLGIDRCSWRDLRREPVRSSAA